MSIHGKGSNDRLRTIWSSEMDHYFISLMIDQLNKGNTINGNLFSKWAWMDMMTAFNEKFKCQYEKEILKNRHKVLRNLYRAVQNILDQKGFSWDDDRQMVIADNKGWDDYIKVHPDARSLRIKTIPYYKELCVIYTNCTILGKLSPSDQNGNVGECITVSQTGNSLEGLEFPDEHSSDFRENTNLSVTPTSSASTSNRIRKNNNATPPSGVDTDLKVIRSRTIWQPKMDQFFIDLMVNHVEKGNKKDGLFPKQVWTEIAKSFNTKFGFKYDIEILKNRFKTLRRQYKIIKNILDMDGFSWDERRQMVAADDCVWQAYIKTHPTARQYMARPVPYYKDLCIICSDMTGNRKDSHPSHHLFSPISPLRDVQSPESSNYSEDQLDDIQESDIRAFGQKDKRVVETPSTKRARNDDVAVTVALNSSLADKKNDDVDITLFSVEKVVEAIQALPEMDEELILDACDYLEDEKKAKMFLALDVKLRKKWLLRKLRS